MEATPPNPENWWTRFRRTPGYLLVLALLAAAVLAAIQLLARGAGPHPTEGAPAPDVTLESMEGGEWTLAGHRGKDAVVLDFFATWCPPCRTTLPELDALAKEMAGQPVAFYSVNIGETAEEVGALFAELGVSLPVLMDPEGQAANAFQVSGIPHMAVIDPAGVIRDVHVGAGWGMKEELRNTLETILAEPLNTTAQVQPLSTEE